MRSERMFFGLAPVIANEAARLPLLRPLLDRLHRRRFRAASGAVRLFHGIYTDFSAASREIPSARLADLDSAGSANRLAHERFRIVPLDYPILFWLHRLLPDCRLLFDLGGNVGISYFGFRRYLQYPAGLRWVINELPAVVEAGKKIATAERATDLGFTTTFEELPAAQILLAMGVLQFIEDPFTLLRSMEHLPPSILLNKVPVHDLPASVTLHSTGAAVCPYHLFNREAFLAQFHSLGYALVDEWENTGLGARIPLHPEHSVASFSGFYFRRASNS